MTDFEVEKFCSTIVHAIEYMRTSIDDMEEPGHFAVSMQRAGYVQGFIHGLGRALLAVDLPEENYKDLKHAIRGIDALYEQCFHSILNKR